MKKRPRFSRIIRAVILWLGVAGLSASTPLLSPAEDGVVGTVDWPGEWIVFGPLAADDPVLPSAELASIPETMEVGGRVLEPQAVKPGPGHMIALEELYGSAVRLTTAYIFLPLQVPEERDVTLGMGGNWWMQAWVNGELVLDTTETSNIHAPIAIDNHLVNVTLREGENVLAVRFICGSGGSEVALGGPEALRRLRSGRVEIPPLDLDPVQTLWDASWVDEQLATAAGRGITLHLERNRARPGERYLEYFVKLAGEVPLEQSRLRIEVFDLETDRRVHEETVAPDGALMLRKLDVRALEASRVRLRIALLEDDTIRGAAEAVLHADVAAQAPEAGERVPVALDLPEGIDAVQRWPVTFGVPFPAGALWSLDGIRLVDREGDEVPFQAEVAALWAPEGAIRWVRFDALADSVRGLAVEAAAPGVGARPRQPVTVERSGGSVTVDTGVARYVIEAGGALIRELHSGEQAVRVDGGRGLYVVDQHGRVATASATGALLDVESAGPVAAGIRIEGPYRCPEGEELARHITRLEFFAGRPEARVIHTLVLTRDTNEIWFDEIGWELPFLQGDGRRALFGTDGEDAGSLAVVPFEEDVAAAALFQAAGTELTLYPHPRMSRWIPSGRGDYAFELLTATADGGTRLLQQGATMGDWAALAGDGGGLFMACRDAARQHPKEFEVFPDRVVLKLFSPRDDASLDFRSPALVERWGLTIPDAEVLDPAVVAEIAEHESNAAGWSRTHELTIAPLPPEGLEEAAVLLARGQHDEVFAHVDPAWIHRSGAMGPLHPRDPERFPEAEHMLEHYMRGYGTQQVPGNVYHGFVDYCTGPHYAYPQRWAQVYDTLTGYWMVYARSGRRDYRWTAQRSVRAYFDGRIAHWDAPNKVRGLMTRAGGPPLTGKSSLPYYWGDSTGFDWGNSTDLQRVLWDYYLTGYRRSRDIVSNHGEGLLRAWRPGGQVFSPRPVTRLLYQAYELDWDPRLRVLAEATTNQRFFEPEGDLLSTKRQPYGCTVYKIEYDIDIPIEIWQLTGSRRYYEIARLMAEFLWHHRGLVGRHSGLGMHFHYLQHPGPAVAADLAHFLRRQTGASYRPDEETYVGVTWSNLTRYFRGIAYAMDAVAATDADRRPLAAMLDFQTEAGPVSVFLRTAGDRATDVVVRKPMPARSGKVDPGVTLIPHAYHGRHSRMGQWLNRVHGISAGFALVRVPYDSVAGAYEIALERPGEYTVIADRRMPLVVAPAGAWHPVFTRPATRFYFKVPAGEDGEAAAIRFENEAVLYTPDGAPWNEGSPVTGWQELPATQPGLWCFALERPGLVEGRNFPQFFAMDDPEFYFEPQKVEE